MDKNKLLLLLKRLYGEYKEQNRSEYLFRCPLCNSVDSKKKLSINLDISSKNRHGNTAFGNWHCWRNPEHKGASLYKLLTATQRASYIPELKDILKDSYQYTKSAQTENIVQTYTPSVSLPKGSKFILNEPISTLQKSAIQYLVNRGLDVIDFYRYNIHYCSDGDYFGYIIFPSYDLSFKMNYYIGRSFTGNSFRYKMPPLSKNIVFNEHLINWNEPVILCEGIFDAIAIGDNAIPILGNSINQTLFDKITTYGQPVYIALDNDIYKVIVSTIKLLLQNNITVYHVKLSEKDPSLMGKDEMKKVINDAELVTHRQFLLM